MVKSWNKWGKVGKSGEKRGIFFTKWPVAAILDNQKSLSIAFLAISDQCTTFNFFYFWMTENHFRSQFSPFHQNFFFNFVFKMAASGHFGSRFFQKSIGTYLYSRSVTISNMKLIGVFLIKFNMECTSFLMIFSQNSRWRPFWFSDFLQNR